MNKSRANQLTSARALVLIMILGVACSGPEAVEPAAGDAMDMETEHEEEMGHDEEMEHDESEPATIPNNGAVIHIVAPADGDIFEVGADILLVAALWWLAGAP